MTTDRLPGPRAGRTLLVFLPGAYCTADDFRTQGFFDAVRARGLPFDLQALDTTLPEYADARFVGRLRDEVVRAARRDGYARVWLVGVSMGGLGALLYAARHRHDDTIDGIVAIAPYPCTREVVNEVRRAGGLAAWQPEHRADDDWERALLVWLRHAHGRPPPIVFAWGEQDRFADSIDLLSAAWPTDHRLVRAGGHDWSTWTRLWNAVLDGHDSKMAA